MSTTQLPILPPVELLERLRSARRVVALTGAGMSAESGIPTFRDKDRGLWARFNPETLATPNAFRRDPDLVWAWYEWRRKLVAQAHPNAGHCALAKLARRPQIEAFTVVTQNVDDLHERGGSEGVTHLHGSLFAPRCFACARPFQTALDAGEPQSREEAPLRLAPPRCANCGGKIRPGVVWFGESLPEKSWRQALDQVAHADLLLVIGTSGRVYPAASLPEAARRHGCAVAVINPEPMSSGPDGIPDLYWNVTAAVGLPVLLDALEDDT